MDGTLPGDTPPLLLCADRDGVRTLTLNRPQARNALSMALIRALSDQLAAAADNPAVRVIVLAAAGPAFCAGHDLRELTADRSEATCRTVFTECGRLMTAIVRLAKPVIASVQGVATAAGCQLVASCDLAVAAESARFATPGVAIGLFCSTPMVALSRAIGRKAAMEMLLTGEAVDAPTAQRLGLVNRVVPDATLPAATAALATQLAGHSPLTVALGKQAFYRQIELPLETAYAYTAEVMTRNMQAHDAAEGIDAFLSRRPPVWTGN